jgi:hypothetical protein
LARFIDKQKPTHAHLRAFPPHDDVATELLSLIRLAYVDIYFMHYAQPVAYRSNSLENIVS